jgi:hypothetical protein
LISLGLLLQSKDHKPIKPEVRRTVSREGFGGVGRTVMFGVLGVAGAVVVIGAVNRLDAIT